MALPHLAQPAMKPLSLKVLRAIYEYPTRQINQAVLADMLEYSRASVNTHIGMLERMGLIEVRQESRRYPCIYKILEPARVYLMDGDND